MSVVAAVGLRREARLLATPGVRFVVGGGDAIGLHLQLDAIASGAKGLISIGIAGALAPWLKPGDWIVATEVFSGGETISTDPSWTKRLADALSARTGPVYAGEMPLGNAPVKAVMHNDTGALAADTESHVVACVAREHGRPFAVARAIADTADQDLPPAALVGMGRDGRMDLKAVMRSLRADPRQIPALVHVAWNAERAFRALLRGRDRLSPGLGLAG